MCDDASNPAERPVEREFAQNRNSFEIVVMEAVFFREDSDGDGQIERGSGFSDFRGSQVYRYALLGKCESRVSNRRAYALATLLDRRVAKPDDGERRESGGDVDLDRDGVSRQSPNG